MAFQTRSNLDEETNKDELVENLIDLPNETLVHILSFIDLSDVPSVASSCSQLNLICQTDLLWKRLFARRWITSQTQHVEALRRENAEQSVKTSWRTYYIHRSLQWKLWTPQFSASPSSGLFYLYTEGKLRRVPGSESEDVEDNPEGFSWLRNVVKEDIASYLIDEDKSYGLNRNDLAHFLTENEVIAIGITSAVFKKIGLEGLNLEQAIRKVFVHLKSPKSGRRTGELLKQFSYAYIEANKDNGEFQSPEEAYTLTYAILVLDTDLHTPQVKNKMKLDTFVSLTGQTVSSKISNEYLKEIYTNIKNNPLSGGKLDEPIIPRMNALQSLAKRLFGIGND